MPDKGSRQDRKSVLFDQFVAAGTFKSIYNTFLELCEHLEIKPFSDHSNFYKRFKSELTSWKAQSLWTKLDKRANRKEYKNNRACSNTNVLVIGCGPCGLRTAIELAMLGAKTIVVEKRDSFSRNNVLHLWPFLINDLRNLGAKKFFGKFCAGSIDHISIRQLQVILLKVALLMGVEVHYNVTFECMEEPPENQENEKIGWRARLQPRDHPVSEFEFDVIVGADGTRNTLKGFNRKEFRGKLAIAITANFINRHTQADARVQEISGVAFIFNQKFFQDLREHTGIDLENIVYYKDETHYFVMTAKKKSLLEKGVIVEDLQDTEKLLRWENVNHDKLLEYAREAADFSTNGQLPSLDYALNHYGQPDVAMFDFTSIYAAKHAAIVRERNGHKLLLTLVGDSLLEPFWPTGSGCARGFLGAFDASWMVKSWASGELSPLEVLAEREASYRLLAQTTPENLSKEYDDYGINPNSRYPVLNLRGVAPREVLHLYDTKDEDLKKQFEVLERKASPRFERSGSVMRSGKLLMWCQRVTESYRNVKMVDMTTSWRTGLALCAIIHRYRPNLIDFESLDVDDLVKNNQLAFDVAEQELGIPPVMTGKEIVLQGEPDKLTMVAYISQFYQLFKDENPEAGVQKTSAISEEEQLRKSPRKDSLLHRLTKRMKKTGRKSKTHDKSLDKIEENERNSPLSPVVLKRKSREKKDPDYHRKRQLLMDPPPKKEETTEEIGVGDIGIRGQNKVSGLAEQLTAQFRTIAGLTEENNALNQSKNKGASGGLGGQNSNLCFFCKKRVYVMERLSAEGLFFHRECFKCQHCNVSLHLGTYAFAPGVNGGDGSFYCRLHFSPSQRRSKDDTDASVPSSPSPERMIHTIMENPGDRITDALKTPPPTNSPSSLKPMNQRYKATPERIESSGSKKKHSLPSGFIEDNGEISTLMQNMQSDIKRFSEEEQAKFNLGSQTNDVECDDEDVSSDSEEDMDDEEREWMEQEVKAKLQEMEEDEDEEMEDEEMESDDEEYDDDDYEDEEYSEEEEEESSEEEEEHESQHLANHTAHVTQMASWKMKWLNDTSSPNVISPVQETKAMTQDIAPENITAISDMSEVVVERENGVSTLEREITSARKEENKDWRKKMARNYASFDDDTPCIRRQKSREAEESVREGAVQENVCDVGKQDIEPDQMELNGNNLKSKTVLDRETPQKNQSAEEDPSRREIADYISRTKRSPKHNIGKNSDSSFTISTPEGSVTDVPTSPSSSISNHKSESSSPKKKISVSSLPIEDFEEIKPKAQISEISIEGSSSKRKESDKKSIEKSRLISNEKGTEENKPYKSVYSRQRGPRSPMSASYTDSFTKTPTLQDINITKRITVNENTNNALMEKEKPQGQDDSVEEFVTPPQTLQASAIKTDTLSRKGSKESRIKRSSKSRSPTKGRSQTSTPVQNDSNNSEAISTTSPSDFHLLPGESQTSEHSPDSGTFQFENGIPRSESHSEEKKLRSNVIRREGKHRTPVRKSKNLAGGVVGHKKGKKSQKSKLRNGDPSEKYSVKEETLPSDKREMSVWEEGHRKQVEPNIIEGLIRGKTDGSAKQLPGLIRKLTVDPDLTASLDIDESSSEEEKEVFETAGESAEKNKKGKTRRMWGKKFKAFNTRAAREDKERRKMEEAELNARLTRRVQREARRQHRQQQLKRHRMAQAIQRQLQEVEVKQRHLEERGVQVEKALRGEEEIPSISEQDLMQQWFSLVNEKNALVRFESELMAQAWELELEDRHSQLEQDLRHRLAIDDSKKTDEDRQVENLLLEEMLEVVEQRDAIVAWLEEERLKEDNELNEQNDSAPIDIMREQREDQDIEAVMLKKGFLTAVQ